MSPQTRTAGFTLLEILVALAVLGFVVAAIGQGTAFGLRAAARQELQAAGRGDLDAVDRLLRRLVAQADPGTSRDPAALRGDPGALAFTTRLGAATAALAPPGSRAQVQLAVEGTTLVLRWQPVRHAIPAGPAPPPDQHPVLDGIDHLELSYWGPVAGQPASWHTAWREPALPGLVRIRLAFPPGSRRRWTDIVAAPATPLPP